MAKLDLTTESAVYVDDSRSLNASTRILSVTDGDESNLDFTPGEDVTLNFGNNREQAGKVAGTITVNGEKLLVIESGRWHYVIGFPHPVTGVNPLPTKITTAINSTNTATDKSGVFTVCFFPGTLIATPFGESRVEDLVPGDQILIDDARSVPETWAGRLRLNLSWRHGSGRAVPVKWLGRQTISTRFGPADRLMPVRFAAGSLGGASAT